jgi:plasmid stability protein
MRQLLLRVPDSVHKRIADRAIREGRSINAVATEIIDAAADADRRDRGARLRAQAAASGVLVPVAGKKVGKAERRRIIEGTRGMGQVADRLIAEERDRV